MPNHYPNYLRLHVETDDAAERTPLPRLSWEQLQLVFARATGWQPLDPPSPNTTSRSSSEMRLERVPRASSAGDRIAASQPPASDPLPPSDPSVRGELLPLAELMGDLWRQREMLLHRLRSSEAELATAIPVISRANDRLADQLEAILRGAAQLTHSTAAALYLLDDATTELKLRACWGMDPTRLSDPARPLRSAMADLEALTGHAVVLEDTRQMAHWNPPLQYASAACVPVRSVSMSLGTLWVFRDQVSDYSDHDTHILEMVAEGMSAELERQVLLREVGKRGTTRDTARALWVPPEIERWDVAGSAVDPIPRGFCFWHARANGQVVLALGEGLDRPELNESLKLMLRAMADFPLTAAELLEHVNQSLWAEGGGSCFASMALALVNPTSGSLDYAQAGQGQAIVGCGDVWRPLSTRTAYLGEHEQLVVHASSETIAPGEWLALVQPADRVADDGQLTQIMTEQFLRQPSDQAQSVADQLAKTDLRTRRPSAVLVARRQA